MGPSVGAAVRNRVVVTRELRAPLTSQDTHRSDGTTIERTWRPLAKDAPLGDFTRVPEDPWDVLLAWEAAWAGA